MFSIGLSTLILFNTLRVSYTFLYYTLDPLTFIENLCVNKDKPELQCNGKCHLKKVSQSSENDNEAVKILDYEILLFQQPTIDYQINASAFIQKKEVFSYLNLYSFQYKLFCFHPPKVLV